MFKVGDKVKVINISFSDYEFYPNTMKALIGRIGKVICIGRNDIRIEVDNGKRWWILEKDLESAQFTKSDLRDTDIVTDKTGYGFWKDINKDNYNEDLTNMYFTCHDLIKVERPKELITVFEREEKTKISVAELVKYYEEKEGKKVEVE